MEITVGLGKVRTPQEILDSIEKVSRESIYEIIRYVFRPEQMGISAIGDIDMDNRLLDKIAF